MDRPRIPRDEDDDCSDDEDAKTIGPPSPRQTDPYQDNPYLKEADKAEDVARRFAAYYAEASNLKNSPEKERLLAEIVVEERSQFGLLRQWRLNEIEKLRLLESKNELARQLASERLKAAINTSPLSTSICR